MKYELQFLLDSNPKMAYILGIMVQICPMRGRHVSQTIFTIT